MELINVCIYYYLIFQAIIFILISFPLPGVIRILMYKPLLSLYNIYLTAFNGRLRYLQNVMIVLIGCLFISNIYKVNQAKISLEQIKTAEKESNFDHTVEDKARVQLHASERNFYLTFFALSLQFIIDKYMKYVNEVNILEQKKKKLKKSQ